MTDIPDEILDGNQYQDTTNATFIALTLNQEAFHDVEFTYQLPESPAEANYDPSKQLIYGHRVIPSVRCPYFRQMFTSGMKESKELKIPVTDVDYMLPFI